MNCPPRRFENLAETDAAQSLSLLQATLESTADGILVRDLNGKITAFNRRFVELWGIPEGVLEPLDDDRALEFALGQLKEPERFLEKVRDLYSNPAAEGFDLLEFRDGRSFERYSRPQRLRGRIVGRVWSFRDVTERERSRAQAQRSADRLKALADMSQALGLATLDRSLILDEATRRMVSLLGMAA